GSMSGCASWVCTMGDAEEDLFQKTKADLAEGSATVVPVNDLYLILFARDAANVVEDDEMGREASFEFIVILFVQVGVVHVQVGRAGSCQVCLEVIIEIVEMGADEVGAPRFHVIAE